MQIIRPLENHFIFILIFIEWTPHPVFLYFVQNYLLNEKVQVSFYTNDTFSFYILFNKV